MSESGAAPRPARKRTVVTSYNLKRLSDTARYTQKSSLKTDRTATNVQTYSKTISPMDSNTTSPLTASTTPPIQSASGISCRSSAAVLPEVHEAGMLWPMNVVSADASTSVAKSPHTKAGCFNKLAYTRGHHYSAHALHGHGVWVGFLAPERHKERFLDLPSFFELKKNFSNMRLPFPPSNQRTSASNCQAVCRGCFSDQSLTLTLREISYVNNKNLVVMPLDGDDDVGMFCILIPQSLDRSMKSLQAWRLYEMGKGCDGKSFENKFELLSLRYPDRETGVMQIIKRNLGSQETGQANPDRDPHKRMATTPASEVLPTIETEERVVALHMSQIGSATHHSERRNDNVATQRIRKRKRSPAAPVYEESSSAMSASYPDSTDPNLTDPLRRISPKPQQMPDNPQYRVSEDQVTTTFNTPMTTGPTTSCASDEHSHSIHIVWILDVDGSTYDLSVTMAECESFKHMIEKLREVAIFVPSALTILDQTNMWQMSYGLPNGRNKVYMAQRDTEVAFHRMRTELAQYVLEVGKTVEVNLTPMG